MHTESSYPQCLVNYRIVNASMIHKILTYYTGLPMHQCTHGVLLSKVCVELSCVMCSIPSSYLTGRI